MASGQPGCSGLVHPLLQEVCLALAGSLGSQDFLASQFQFHFKNYPEVEMGFSDQLSPFHTLGWGAGEVLLLAWQNPSQMALAVLFLEAVWGWEA